MLRKCLRCCQEYQGSPGSTLCKECAAVVKKNNVIRTRVCKQCGTVFQGGPRAWYCPMCRSKRKMEADKRHKKNGASRKIGSTDACVICMEPYTVNSARQKYCPKCAPDAIRAIDREQGRLWSKENADNDARRERRHEATAEKYCVICGKEFKPGCGDPHTCSPDCSKELARRTMKKYEISHRKERSEYHKELYKQRIEEMTPEELQQYRDSINARARKNYAIRKKNI